MAIWGKIGSRGHVEDRRSFGPVGLGSIGITGVLLIMGINLLLGADPIDILNQLQTIPIQQGQPVNPEEFTGQDTYEVFASTVLGSNNQMWQKIFSDLNRSYQEPRLVLFRAATESDCGGATSQIGPHYCPLDQTIYLDETFFDELINRFGAQGGDVAEAYVIAHEVAHHVQNQLGILDTPQTNRDSIQVELQADCFAGLWANSIKDLGVLLPDEIKEAMDAAAAVGDDRIQKQSKGYINPETWTHGSSTQRLEAFSIGYNTGSYSACQPN